MHVLTACIEHRAFSDMELHILELRQDGGRTRQLTLPLTYEKGDPIPVQHNSFAASSLIHMRPWTHLALNEGSFLKAYGTYEFFERGPPSLVCSINQCFTRTDDGGSGMVGVRSLPALRSFTYTAIFPFANHVDFSNIVPQLEELDLQFAPDLHSRILDDKRRTGRAELQDCWQELISAYQRLARTMNTFTMSGKRFPKLKKFVCRDSQIPALREELDEVFTPLCLPVWVEPTHGIFERVAMSPHLRPADDEVDPWT